MVSARGTGVRHAVSRALATANRTLLDGTWRVANARVDLDRRHRVVGAEVMVAVLDLLPGCVSSVYLYYDPKWEFLNPGTLTAVREIEFIKKVR